MNSLSPSWKREIFAIFRKEWSSEMRSKSGLLTAGLFSLVAVIAIALAGYGKTFGGSLASGLLWVTWLFSGAVGLPRAFLLEEEQRTGDLLRLWARPEAVFWGKCLFNVVQMLLSGAVVSVLFLAFTSQHIKVPWLFGLTLVGGCSALAGAVTLCGALVAQASNRAAMAAAVSVPLLLPLVALGVSAMRVSLGEGFYEGGVQAAIGLVGYAAVTLVTGPTLFAAVWKS